MEVEPMRVVHDQVMGVVVVDKGCPGCVSRISFKLTCSFRHLLKKISIEQYCNSSYKLQLLKMLAILNNFFLSLSS